MNALEVALIRGKALNIFKELAYRPEGDGPYQVDADDEVYIKDFSMEVADLCEAVLKNTSI